MRYPILLLLIPAVVFSLPFHSGDSSAMIPEGANHHGLHETGSDETPSKELTTVETIIEGKNEVRQPGETAVAKRSKYLEINGERFTLVRTVEGQKDPENDQEPSTRNDDEVETRVVEVEGQAEPENKYSAEKHLGLTELPSEDSTSKEQTGETPFYPPEESDFEKPAGESLDNNESASADAPSEPQNVGTDIQSSIDISPQESQLDSSDVSNMEPSQDNAMEPFSESGNSQSQEQAVAALPEEDDRPVNDGSVRRAIQRWNSQNGQRQKHAVAALPEEDDKPVNDGSVRRAIQRWNSSPTQDQSESRKAPIELPGGIRNGLLSEKRKFFESFRPHNKDAILKRLQNRAHALPIRFNHLRR